MNFQLESSFSPQGDQLQAIEKLEKSILAGNAHQTLWGVTGSGKTFTMANLIARLNRPTLLISHNKTLAAQLYSEFKSFFPHNAVEYFVSYFDYYQPEAYIPRTDTFIEKDSAINDEIERLRLSTMSSLLTRKDTIVIASVSCIYGLGSPDDYRQMTLLVQQGQTLSRDEFLHLLVSMLYERNDFEWSRGKFRVRGDVVDIHPAFLEKSAIRIEFFGDEVERITLIDALTGQRLETLREYLFFPAKQFVTAKDKMQTALSAIKQEMLDQIHKFESEGKLLEAQRIKLRTEYDMEMMAEMGFCQGIENYSRHLTQRQPGETPHTLLDFFPENFLTLIDESHVSIPQIGGMYEGDQSRKKTLVEHGFRLPSALDNRPLRLEEFMRITQQRLYISATPAAFELVNSRPDVTSFLSTNQKDARGNKLIHARNLNVQPSSASQPTADFDVTSPATPLVVEQIIRPTGLLDPIIRLLPLKSQIDETIALCHDRIAKNERVLITTLTKKTAENLTDYLTDAGLRVRYIHADVDAIQRVEILRELRAGKCDILVGINLLREGLDLPEVSLVCILDADKEGFLRNDTSLIQTAGRAARHQNGECILFCDTVTQSIQRLLDISHSRRTRQEQHNLLHNITPKSVSRGLQQSLSESTAHDDATAQVAESHDTQSLIQQLEREMREASSRLEFELAAHLRDQIQQLQNGQAPTTPYPKTQPKKRSRPKK